MREALDEEPAELPMRISSKLLGNDVLEPVEKPELSKEVSDSRKVKVNRTTKIKPPKKVTKKVSKKVAKPVPKKVPNSSKNIDFAVGKSSEKIDDKGSEYENYEYDSEEMWKLLTMLSTARVNNYDDWMKIGMAIYSWSNGTCFEIWNRLSQKRQKYDSSVCKQKWNFFKTKPHKFHRAVVTIIEFCRKDSPEEYEKFEIKRKSDRMILEKYPDLELDLGRSFEVSGRKCTIINNNKCIFTEKPHEGFGNTMLVEVNEYEIMEIRCYHVDCMGKSFPNPSIKLTRNEMNIMGYGTANITMGCPGTDNQHIEVQRYDIFENDTVNELVNKSLTGCHSEIANIVYYYFKDKYNVGENDNWYVYGDHKWNLVGLNNDNFSHEMRNKLKSIYNQLIDHGKKTRIDDEKIKEFEKLNKMIGNARTRRDIMSVAKEIFRKNNNSKCDFVKNLDKNQYLIVFNNGVYDLKNHTFRDGRPNDMVSMSVGYDYNSKHTKKFVKLSKYLGDIQPNDEEREYLLTYLSSALHGKKLEYFTILTGGGSNGKSKFIELVKRTFGDYYGLAKSQLFTRPLPDATEPDPGLLSLRNKKIVISSEPKNKSKLNSGFIKFITGSGSTQLHDRHNDEMIDFDPKFVTIMVCNNMPEIDEIDAAFSKRLRCINFPTEFCDNPMDNPTKDNQKLIDTDISDNFDDWRMDFMLLLIGYYKKYVRTKKLTTTDNIMK